MEYLIAGLRMALRALESRLLGPLTVDPGPLALDLGREEVERDLGLDW